jgi:hypothetical protein
MIPYNKIIQYKRTCDDLFNKVQKGEILIEYYYKNIYIGFIKYRSHNGHIGLIWFDELYVNKKLKKKIISHIIVDMISLGSKKIWCIEKQDPSSVWDNKLGFIYEENINNLSNVGGYYLCVTS